MSLDNKRYNQLVSRITKKMKNNNNYPELYLKKIRLIIRDMMNLIYEVAAKGYVVSLSGIGRIYVTYQKTNYIPWFMLNKKFVNTDRCLGFIFSYAIENRIASDYGYEIMPTKDQIRLLKNSLENSDVYKIIIDETDIN